MPGSFQNKIQQHEVVPPPAVWDRISLQLDDEFRQSDSSISSKIENISLTPPPSSWDAISSSLNKIPERKTPAKVIPMIYKRLAIAVIFAGILAVTAMYLFTGGKNKSVFKGTENTIVNKTPEVNVPVPETSIPVTTNRDSVKQPGALSRLRNTDSRRIPDVQSATEEFQEPVSSNFDQPHLSGIQTLSALQPVNVVAPPIRDSRGNIIMDLSVITRPGNPYITVTGPNGSQTRISNKFLPCLSYLNNDHGIYNPEGMQWKERFQEWRNKLLSEGSFVPSASNFFDIFELKEMIQDN